MSKKERPFSENISDIVKVMEEAQKNYEWNLEMMTKMDDLTQDYLHSLELSGMKYDERAKVATKLAACRRERRGYKDAVTVLEPLIELLDTEYGRRFTNMLRESLGKTRKIEKKMGYRTYRPRVLEEVVCDPT